MTCPGCQAQGHVYHNGCRGCAIRAAWRSQEFFDSRMAGKLTGHYRTLLERLGLTHEEVLEAWKNNQGET
jgi:hypothetical protein